jgi:hypothetical protein
MNRRTFAFGLTALVAAVAIGFAIRFRTQAVHWLRTPDELHRRYDELERQLQAENQRIAADERQAADLQRSLAAAHAAASRASAAAQSGVDPRKLIAATPALRAAYLKLFRDGLDVKWGLLYKMLGLSPDQVDKFKDLLTQREEVSLEMTAAAQAQGFDGNSPEWDRLFRQLNNPVREGFVALLGQTGYATYKQYNNDSAVLPVVGDLAAALDPSATLSVPQATQLITAFADSSQKDADGKAQKNTLDWNQAMTRASAILAPNQLSVLGLLQQDAETGKQIDQITASLPK